MDSNKILDTDTENLTEEEKLERFKKLTDILSRDISRRLDEINSHINAIDLALESVIDMYTTILEDGDDTALVSLIRVAKKYSKQFDIWSMFIKEDCEMVKKITKRFSDKLPTDNVEELAEEQ
jgi:hypothetical protein